NVGRAAIRLAPEPVLRNLRERRNLGWLHIVATRDLVFRFRPKLLRPLARLEAHALPRAVQSQGPIVEHPQALAIAAAAARYVELSDACHRHLAGDMTTVMSRLTSTPLGRQTCPTVMPFGGSARRESHRHRAV